MQQRSSKRSLLLLQDVYGLGRKGEIVTAKPGYMRNYLLPNRLAEVATPNILRKQEKLREEREKQGHIDRKEAEELAIQIGNTPLEIKVKVDPEGHMYGSVSAFDVAELYKQRGLPVDRRFILLPRPIKTTGMHTLSLSLKEGVEAKGQLHVIPEGISKEALERITRPLPPEEAPPAV